MKSFIAAAVQFAIEPNDVEQNISKACEWLEQAVTEHDAELVVFPESVTTGFTPGIPISELIKRIDEIPGKTTRDIQHKAEEFGVHIIWPTYELADRSDAVYNSAALIDDNGDIIGVYRKTHPFPTERLGGGGWTIPGEKAEVFKNII